MRRFIQNWQLHTMMLIGMLFIIIFSYIPMVGVVIAFQDFIPARGFFGSDWIGLENFRIMFAIPDTARVLSNTIFIALLKIIFNFITPILFALLLNEVSNKRFKRTIQTAVYFPHFLSWVILGGMFVDLLSLNSGAINNILESLGFERVFFLGNPSWFRKIVVITDVWKNFGFGTIVYLAAISGIDPTLYEAALVDGAGRWKQTVHITVPSIANVIVLMATLSLGGILNAGFDQIFNLYNVLVYRTGDIIDTWVYRMGLVRGQYGLATAMGLLKSAVGMLFIVISYRLASRYANYKIF